MAITVGDWASSGDPFILAKAHAYTSTLPNFALNRIDLFNSEGFLSAIVDDRDIQELFWSKDSDKEITWFVNASMKAGHTSDQLREIGKYQERFGSTFELFEPREIFLDDPQTLGVYITGKATGSVLYSLFAYTAYSWIKKDPAQILFSWIAHHVDSPFILKDFLNQTSFQDASDYYDENPINLSLYREAGSTIAQQIKKVMAHTSDFMAIRPADADGKMQMHITPRQDGIVSRTTAIDLDSKSVERYVIRPTDRYTVDRIDALYGGMFFVKSTGEADSPDDYNVSPGDELPGSNRTILSQKVGSVSEVNELRIEVPYHTTRGAIYNHLDIGQWILDQDEVEIDFADWSHMNFEDGDLVPITGGKANYSGELFLVTEKTRDLDSMLASARFLRLRAVSGKRPALADAANLLISLAPNSLGDYFDHGATFPRDVFLTDDPRNIDRVWDLSNNYAHLAEMPRGGTPAGNLRVDPETRGRWPGLLNDGTEGADFPAASGEYSGISSAAASDITAYFVINPDATNLTNVQYLFEQDGTAYDLAFAFNSGGVTQLVQFYDGVGWRGTKVATSGWQILTFVLNSTGATIRRNGSNLDTGLAYTQVRLFGAFFPGYTQSLLVAAAGDASHFKGEFMEFHMFESGHDATTVDAIEEYLADKYSITI